MTGSAAKEHKEHKKGTENSVAFVAAAVRRWGRGTDHVWSLEEVIALLS
jgi:hypothetical protein